MNSLRKLIAQQLAQHQAQSQCSTNVKCIKQKEGKKPHQLAGSLTHPINDLSGYSKTGKRGTIFTNDKQKFFCPSAPAASVTPSTSSSTFLQNDLSNLMWSCPFPVQNSLHLLQNKTWPLAQPEQPLMAWLWMSSSLTSTSTPTPSNPRPYAVFFTTLLSCCLWIPPLEECPSLST